jgi:peptide/nickel transport system ATP-binding protein
MTKEMKKIQTDQSPAAPVAEKEQASLEIKDLRVSYNGLPVLNGIDLLLRRGDTLAIIGESGAGKTTLGLSILGLVEGLCRGEIFLNGQSLLTLPEEKWREKRGRDMAMVFQNVSQALHPLYTIRDQIAESIMVHGLMDKEQAKQRVFDMLHFVGFDRRKARAFPHQLSGGEKQKALITMALINDPGLLILDEPTASLDVLTKEEIIKLLKGLIREKMTLLITHDISVAARITDFMGVLYGGRILEWGPTRDLIANPRHPYTRGLLRSFPNMTTTKDLQGIPGRMTHGIAGCAFHPRCTQRIAICHREVPRLTDSGIRRIACHRGGIVPLMECLNVSKSFGLLKALDRVGMTIYEGETLSLVGESGSGKTTLAKTIMGLLSKDGGDIILAGDNTIWKKRGFYERVQMIFQNPSETISHRMTVLDAVREPLDIHKKGNREERRIQVKQVLDDVELPSDDEFLRKYPHHLSGGEIQRVAIARALIMNPRFLIADEPTSSLDVSVQAKILKLIMTLQEKRGLAILFITHDIALARKVSDRMAVMLTGRIIEKGPTHEVIGSPMHPYTESLIQLASALSHSHSEQNQGSRDFAGWNAGRADSGNRILPPSQRPVCKNQNKTGHEEVAPLRENQRKRPLKGCGFAPRCPVAIDNCFREVPELKGGYFHQVACFMRDASKGDQ